MKESEKDYLKIAEYKAGTTSKKALKTDFSEMARQVYSCIPEDKKDKVMYLQELESIIEEYVELKEIIKVRKSFIDKGYAKTYNKADLTDEELKELNWNPSTPAAKIVKILSRESII